jgi:Tol biopolymer transport system component
VTGVPIPARGGRDTRLAWAVAALALLAAAGVSGWAFLRQPAPAAAIRFRLSDVAGATDYFWPRVSPDGRFILLQGTDSSNTPRAYVRPIDQINAVPIPGTEGMRRAYWSPDGREIVFVLGDQIMRAPVGGGSPTVICAAQGGVDLSWGSKGKLLMDGRFVDSLRVVDAGGGEMRPATRVYRGDGEVGSGWPCFLPDGEHFLFTGNLNNAAGRGNIRLGKLGSLESKKLGTTDGRVEYAPGGWVLFLRGRTLLAQKLDLGAGKLVGEPVTLADGVRMGAASGHFSVSPTGVLAFSRETGGDAVTLREVNRTGANVGAPILSGLISNPQISPDGQRMLYLRLTSGVGTDGDVSVFDLARGTDTKLTFSGGSAATPVWSPDGRRFAYITRPIGAAPRIRIASADGMGAVDSIDTPDRAAGSLTAWIFDRSRLLYSTPDFRAFEVAVEGPAPNASPLIDSVQFRGHNQMSPDGRWLAFVQGAAPNIHVFVQTLEGTAGRWQISTAPAIRPRWVRGGRGLVFEGLDGRLMEVDIDTSAGFRPGTPRPLFTLPVAAAGPELFTWSCDSAGERFFVLVPPTARTTGIVEVVSDFASLVNRRRP